MSNIAKTPHWFNRFWNVQEFLYPDILRFLTMKKEYPQYRKERFSTKSLYDSFSAIDRESIVKFIDYCRGSVTSETKLNDIKMHIVQFRDVMQKPFDKLTLEDVRAFITLLNQSGRKVYTQNSQKAYVKKFLKWKFKDWGERFNYLNDIKLNKEDFNEERINKHTLIQPEEHLKLLQFAEKKGLQDYAMYLTLVELGCRPQELLNLKWSDIKFKEDGFSEINIFSTKTRKSRTGFIKDSVVSLKKLKVWANGKPTDWVFPNPSNPKEHYPKSTFYYWFKQIVKGAEIDREMFPYLARHTKAHELYKKLPSVLASKAMGHKIDMSKVYAHIDSDDIKEELSKLYQIEEMSKEKKQELEMKFEILLKFVCEHGDYPKNDLKKLAKDLSVAGLLVDNKAL